MECINIEKWDQVAQTTKGSREKRWVFKSSFDTKIELFLFKESGKRYPLEFWSEVIAYEVGKIVNINVPECKCAKLGDKYGALIKFFLVIEDEKIIENLEHGGDLITAVFPSFDRKKGEKHNVCDVIKILKNFDKSFVNEFLRILVFDSLIGNTDRHQDNWGIILGADKNVKLSPAFDNGASLGREQVEKKLCNFLEENMLKLNTYIEKGKPHIRWSEDGKNLMWLSHFELLKKLEIVFPILVDYVEEITNFNNSEIEKIVYNIDQIEIKNSKYKMTKDRGDFIKRIIFERKKLLRKRFLNE